MATTIKDLSSGGPILSSDTIFIFSKNIENDTYEIIKVTANQLSSQFVNFNLLAQINDKYNELQRLSTNFKQFLKENYTLSNKIETIYSTKKYFDSVYMHNNTTTTVLSNEFADFVSKSSANKYKEYALAEVAKYKNTSSKIVGQLVTEAPGWM